MLNFKEILRNFKLFFNKTIVNQTINKFDINLNECLDINL